MLLQWYKEVFMAISGGSIVNLVIEMVGIMVSLFSILLLGFGFR